MTIGVKLGNKIGARFITLIGAILINLSFILMMISTNSILMLISMCILGLGCGLSYLSVVKNCWEYYPNRLGLIYGIIIAGFRLSSLILTYIFEFIIHIPDKFLYYIILLSILVFMLSIIAVCLTFNYQEEEDLSKIEELNEKKKLENNDPSSLCACFFFIKKSFPFIFLFLCTMYLNINIIFFIVSCFIISSTMGNFGNIMSIDLYRLYLIRYLYDSFYVVTSFIFGLLMDKYGFKIINIIISSIEIGVSFTFYFFAYTSGDIFAIEIILISCCLSGLLTTITPLFNKVFGKEISLEIYGITVIFLYVPYIPIELLKLFIIKEAKNYLILYLIGSGISLIKLISLIFFKENKLYKFNSNKEEDYNNIEKINDIGINK